jgi:AmmeMemoRadiSam system protein B
MNMLEAHHQGIFYPEDPAELARAVQPRKSAVHLSTLPSALLCPHAAYELSQEALHTSFSVAAGLQCKLVVALVPLHQEVLVCDEPAFVFSPTADGMTIGGMHVRFATEMRAHLQKLFAPYLALQDSYFEEESAFELTLPFINSYLPNTPVLGLAVGSCTKEQIAKLEHLLGAITEREPQTLVVVSCNANALLPSDVAAEHATTFADLLHRGGDLWEAQHHHRVSCCNLPSLEAIMRQPWGSQPWQLHAWYCKGQVYPAPSVLGEGKEKNVWHLSASLGEIHASETNL